MIAGMFYYRGNRLKAEKLDVDDIIRTVGTPAYIYSQNSFLNQLKKLQSAFQKFSTIICYSLKVCHNVNIIRLFVNEGCGLDIVSGGELYRARKAGGDPRKIVYSGAGKTEKEIEESILAGILMLNVESQEELERINAIGGRLKKIVPIAIRVNPGVDAKTHPYITTGMKKNKFGIDHEMVLDGYKMAGKMANVEIVGIDCHIGSQLLDVKPFGDAMKIVAEYVGQLSSEGIRIKYVDAGGGLGIPYEAGEEPVSVEEYARLITEPFAGIPGITFILEPGRFLTAQGGILVTRVQYVKENLAGKRFVITDSGMHHLIRAPLYQAHHNVLTVIQKNHKQVKVDVVGPICESSDFLCKDCLLEEVLQDDLLAVTDCGAYGIVLGSHYNSHSLPVEVLVNESEYEVIRRRETYEDLLSCEIV